MWILNCDKCYHNSMRQYGTGVKHPLRVRKDKVFHSRDYQLTISQYYRKFK
jgi:hypothetical protein